MLICTACTPQTSSRPTTTTTTATTTTTEARPPQYDPTTQTDPVQIQYIVSTKGGTIRGETTQTLTPTDPVASNVEAEAELGYRFTRWSDGSTDPVRFGDSFSTDTTLIAYFEVDYKNLPAVHLNTQVERDQITREEYVDGSISIDGESISSDDRIFDCATRVRGRGHGSWSYQKKGWKLHLSTARSLLGLGEGKSKEWVLIANQVDRSLLRNAAATWIQNQLDLIWAPDYAFVDLYFNGEYMGVYQLYEQIEEDEHKVSMPMGTVDDVSYFAEISVHAEEPRVRCSRHYYEIHSELPTENTKDYLNAISDHLHACYQAVEAGNYEAINELMDIASMVDAYIVEELVKNLDSGWDSFYLYRHAGGKLSFGPVWDFDMSSGNVKADPTSPCHLTFQEPQGLYAGNTAAGGDRQQNQWFQMLMELDWFVELVKIRWQEISPKMAELPDLLLQTGETYQVAFERNFQKWNILTKRLTTEADVILTLDTYDKQLHYLADWYRLRIAWLDEVWGDSE